MNVSSLAHRLHRLRILLQEPIVVVIEELTEVHYGLPLIEQRGRPDPEQRDGASVGYESQLRPTFARLECREGREIVVLLRFERAGVEVGLRERG